MLGPVFDLTLEQELEVQIYAQRIESLNREQAIEELVNCYAVMLHKDNLYKRLIANAKSILSGRKMKIYKVTLTIIDFDKIGADGVREVLENTTYPNHCICPKIRLIQTRDCGEWHDDHPLNHEETEAAEIDRLFGEGNEEY